VIHAVLVLFIAPPIAADTLPLLRVVASDYAYQAPAVFPAGKVRVRLVDVGQHPHHLVLSRMDDTLSLQQFFSDVLSPHPHGGYHDVGGPNMVAPGDSAEVWLTLTPGHYALSCWVFSRSGQPHIAKGMFAEVLLRPGPTSPGEIPPGLWQIAAREYRLDGPDTVEAGTVLVTFVNMGQQEHDVQLVRLPPRGSLTAVTRWADAGMEGPVPGTLTGGASGIEPGMRVSVPLQLRRGRYALFCFVPDERDGKPHYAHGMVRLLVVR